MRKHRPEEYGIDCGERIQHEPIIAARIRRKARLPETYNPHTIRNKPYWVDVVKVTRFGDRTMHPAGNHFEVRIFRASDVGGIRPVPVKTWKFDDVRDIAYDEVAANLVMLND